MIQVDVPPEVLDEARTVNDVVEQLLATVPSAHTRPPEETRQLRAEGVGPLGAPARSDRASNRVVGDPARSVPVRVLAPENPDGVFLHIHGGGWVLGAADQQDLLLETLADEANVAVVSVDYRLAPEHPYPAGPDDCETAACWLLESAFEEFGTDCLMIGGESAGAHLSAVTLLRLRDRHGIRGAFAGANLVFGAYDLTLTPSARGWGERNLILSTPIIRWFADLFLPGRDEAQRAEPDVSPLYADLTRMPPALFTVGTLDPLLDDSLLMAERWEAAGNDTELLVYPEAPHGFHAFPTALARMAIDAQLDFVRRTVAGG